MDSCPGAEKDPCSFTISMTLADSPYLYAQTVTKTFQHRIELELFQISMSGVKWKPGHVSLPNNCRWWCCRLSC